MAYKDIEKRKENSREYARKNYARDRVRNLATQKRWRNKLKITVLTHYSDGNPKCACCGEKIIEFLTLDHINNNGTQERKKYQGGGHHHYRKVIKDNFPDGFQVLCFNCNCGRAKTIDKICPHKIHEKNSNKEEK